MLEPGFQEGVLKSWPFPVLSQHISGFSWTKNRVLTAIFSQAQISMSPLERHSHILYCPMTVHGHTLSYSLLSCVTTGGQTLPYSLLSYAIATGIPFTALMEATSSYTWASSPLSKPSSWAQTHHLGESERWRNDASSPLQEELSPLWRINSRPFSFRSKVQI